MYVMVVGGGGREHALVWAATNSPAVTALAVTHANPGFPDNASVVTGDPVEWAVKEGVDLVLVGPEVPLAGGLANRLRAQGISVLGPNAEAAQLESSKAFAKAFMDRHSIPTAAWSVHDSPESALSAIDGPCVVKADGLAAGKGVVVAQDAQTARAAVQDFFSGRLGEAGLRVVIEERLVGPEVSIIALCDGSRAVAMLPCRDHKRRFEDDEGPNTGGMGAVCPPQDVDQQLVQSVMDSVIHPVVRGMAEEGHVFRGVLYAGVMLTPDGPKVLEFNVRFGDPECQPLMVMAGEDLIPWFAAAADGCLPDRDIRWRDGAACCVVMVSDGYPGAVEKGKAITGVADTPEDAVVFCAGMTRNAQGVLCTNGGRVLGVTAWGANLSDAKAKAYEGVSRIQFDGASWRRDIGGWSL